jgi:hypothetical protein
MQAGWDSDKEAPAVVFCGPRLGDGNAVFQRDGDPVPRSLADPFDGHFWRSTLADASGQLFDLGDPSTVAVLIYVVTDDDPVRQLQVFLFPTIGLEVLRSRFLPGAGGT